MSLMALVAMSHLVGVPKPPEASHCIEPERSMTMRTLGHGMAPAGAAPARMKRTASGARRGRDMGTSTSGSVYASRTRAPSELVPGEARDLAQRGGVAGQHQRAVEPERHPGRRWDPLRERREEALVDRISR